MFLYSRYILCDWRYKVYTDVKYFYDYKGIYE